MGATSVQLEHELDARRQALGARSRRLRQRIAEDRKAVRAQLGAYGQRALELAGTSAGCDSAVAHHPRMVVAGAAAAGAALGLSTASDSDERSGRTSAPLFVRAGLAAARRTVGRSVDILASAGKSALVGAIATHARDDANGNGGDGRGSVASPAP